MDVGSYLDATVELAADLVNRLTPGHARGRQLPAPDAARRREEVLAAFGDRPNRMRQWARQDDPELARLAGVVGELRHVFVSADAGDVDTAAAQLNRLMRDHNARPELSHHDDQPWHLHFHQAAATPTGGIVAACAVALAFVLASDEARRLGVCQAHACDRVFVDTSRNASRRFCSTACQNRVKAAAFRARRADASD